MFGSNDGRDHRGRLKSGRPLGGNGVSRYHVEQLYQSGKTTAEIAAALSVSRQTVCRHLRLAGIVPDRRQSKSTFRGNPIGQPSAKQLAIAALLREPGATLVSVARLMGITKQCVHQIKRKVATWNASR